MLADHEITRDELFAVGATFTLVAWGFAYAFTVCQAIEPGSFTAAAHPAGERDWVEWSSRGWSASWSSPAGGPSR